MNKLTLFTKLNSLALFSVRLLREHQVERLDSEGSKLAEYLGEFVDRYDMDGILNVLGKIQDKP